MESINALVTQLGSGDQVKEYQARLALFLLVWRAGKPGGEVEQAQVADALAVELTAADGGKPRHAARVRGELCRLLSKIATDQHVPAIGAALADAETREMARWALDRIQSPLATAALIETATKGSGTEFRVGAVAALGSRQGPEATAALNECAANQETEIRLAALEALANQPEAASDALITAAMATETAPRAKKRLAKARIRLGDRLLSAGNREAAKAIFQEVAASAADQPQKDAAARALAEIG